MVTNKMKSKHNITENWKLILSLKKKIMEFFQEIPLNTTKYKYFAEIKKVDAKNKEITIKIFREGKRWKIK